jgi:hypothetical protein
MSKYKEINGTSYNSETSKEVIDVLENARKNKIRIVVDYGDIETGKSWNEEFGVCGYVGRSTGKIKIPLLVYNKRSFGGGGILDSCIIKISTSAGKKVLYQHEKYNK